MLRYRYLSILPPECCQRLHFTAWCFALWRDCCHIVCLGFALELLSRQPMPATMFEVTCRWPVLKQHGKKIWNKCNCIMGCWSHMWAFVKCSSKCSTDMITCLDTFSLARKVCCSLFPILSFFLLVFFFFIPVNGKFGVDEECRLCTSTWLQKFKTVVEYAIVMWNF